MVVKGKGARNFARRTFHSLRHSLISALANRNVRPEVSMKISGHQSSEIHRKYTHYDFKPLKDAMDSLRPAATGK